MFNILNNKNLKNRIFIK